MGCGSEAEGSLIWAVGWVVLMPFTETETPQRRRGVGGRGAEGAEGGGRNRLRRKWRSSG